MPGGITPSQNMDERNLEWIHIEDFSPGCYDGSFISGQHVEATAPLGAADIFHTFCCAAIPGTNSLGPLPALTFVAEYDYSSFPGIVTELLIGGFAINPNSLDGIDEIITLLEGDDGIDHYNLGWSTQLPSSDNLFLNVAASTNGGVLFGYPYPQFTRMNSGGTADPPPVLVFPSVVTSDGNGANGHIYVYPSLGAPSTFSFSDLIAFPTTGPTAGQLICYGSRVIGLGGIGYQWPAGGGVSSNENIGYTDPPTSAAYGNQQEILGAEEPWGYGTWGSVSLGELLLIKKYGGAVMVNGDIANPNSVIDLRGVQPTGSLFGRADPTVIGIVYCSENEGAWVWNGSNVSTKISSQLRDDFFDATTATGLNAPNHGFYVGHWQNWILFSNNAMYESDTNSWWSMYPTNGLGNANVPGKTIYYWWPGKHGNEMWAAPLSMVKGAGSSADWFYKFDNAVPAPHWQWQSLPIHVDKHADRVLDMRQLVIRASDPSNSGTATVSAAIGSWAETSTTTIEYVPTALRFNVGAGALGLQEIVMLMTGDNPGASAPIIHSIDIGYQVRAGVPVEV